jgi:hypothetical protein
MLLMFKFNSIKNNACIKLPFPSPCLNYKLQGPLIVTYVYVQMNMVKHSCHVSSIHHIYIFNLVLHKWVYDVTPTIHWEVSLTAFTYA